MSRLQDLEAERQTLGSVVLLTSAFEGIASMHIASIKDQVASSEMFFKELWQIYSQLVVDEDYHRRTGGLLHKKHRKLIIVVSSEGGLSGDIDKRLVDELVASYTPAEHDVVVIGHHGASLLRQRGISCENIYNMPDNEDTLPVEEILKEIQQYKSCTVYYQSYVSLMFQEIKQIELQQTVQERGKKLKNAKDVISSENYIFEPSLDDVVKHLERSMMWVALKEVILSSRLAQEASRFKAMTSARNKADESLGDLKRQISHSKRALNDERTREMVNSLGVNGGRS